MYTSHGHLIPGSPSGPPFPEAVARCGGVMLCRDCQAEAARWLVEQGTSVKTTALILGIPEAKVRGVKYKVYAEITVPIEKAGIEAWNKYKEALEKEGISVERMILDPIKDQK